MSYPKHTYVYGVLKGLECVLTEIIKLQKSECNTAWNNSIVKSAADQICTKSEKLEFRKLNPTEVNINS